MRAIALCCAALIAAQSRHLMASELLIWGAYPHGEITRSVFHISQGDGDGVTCVKLCPTGQNQHSAEKLGAIILTSDQTVLAVGPVSSSLVPPPTLKDVVDIATGYNHAIALTRNGSVVVWGEDFSATNDVSIGLSDVVSVGAGLNTFVALRSNGTVSCWFRGEINRPWKGLDQIKAVSLSPELIIARGLALKRDGTVLQWSRRTMTSPVAGISNIVAVSASPAHCLALTSDATLVSWGSDAHGEKSIPPGLSNVAAIATGGSFTGLGAAMGHSLALKKDGTLVGWGQIGRGKGDIVPPGISNVVAIAAGDGFCMAITTDAAVAERFRESRPKGPR